MFFWGLFLGYVENKKIDHTQENYFTDTPKQLEEKTNLDNTSFLSKDLYGSKTYII